MFAGPAISIEFYKGWFPIVIGLCFEIDRMLGAHRDGFHWIQIKEKFGTMRLHFDLRGKLQGLVVKAGGESAQSCMVCGEIAERSHQSAWTVTVCEVHALGEVRKRGGPSLRELMKVPEHPEDPV